MQLNKIQQAAKECHRFLRDVEMLIRLTKAAGNNEMIFASKLSGQVRRASMDLTRALAEMRKP